ncbi:hypothetical protein ACH4S8_37845 [Streptomyces sp. NPDC021080]|uniref:hypothetical protein n=1 Tax=Streptomyces sp. NPDC021080 TaxID=3365110 RepID=UPI00378B5559
MNRFLLGLALALGTFAGVRYGTGNPGLAIFVMSMVALTVWFLPLRCLCERCVNARYFED